MSLSGHLILQRKQKKKLKFQPKVRFSTAVSNCILCPSMYNRSFCLLSELLDQLAMRISRIKCSPIAQDPLSANKVIMSTFFYSQRGSVQYITCTDHGQSLSLPSSPDEDEEINRIVDSQPSIVNFLFTKVQLDKTQKQNNVQFLWLFPIGTGRQEATQGP